MATLQKAVLTVDADVDGDGAAETGEFHMAGNLEVTPGLRTGYLVGGRGSTVNSILSSTLGDGSNVRQGFYLDLGGGAHTVDIQFRGWEGATDQSGTPVQWGNEGVDDTPTKADATGADPITQIDVLMRYLTRAEIDSRSPATLEYGEYSSGGLYSAMNVVVEGPNFTRSAQDGSWFDGSLTCIRAADLNDALDAIKQVDY